MVKANSKGSERKISIWLEELLLPTSGLDLLVFHSLSANGHTPIFVSKPLFVLNC